MRNYTFKCLHLNRQKIECKTFYEHLQLLIAYIEIEEWIRKAIKQQGCSRAVMVAHNAHFDLGFVNAAAERCRGVHA